MRHGSLPLRRAPVIIWSSFQQPYPNKQHTSLGVTNHSKDDQCNDLTNHQHAYESSLSSAAAAESTTQTVPLSSSTSRWSSLLAARRTIISNLLVCGDGDLSFSASIAPELAVLGVHLTATVLEDQTTHHSDLHHRIRNE
eukprot:scaffold120195_cov53-Attheya_sp.AAC.1